MTLQQQQQELTGADDYSNEKSPKFAYGMHCNRGIENSTPVMERKQAPEPPQRHCSTMLASSVNASTEHMDSITVASQHQSPQPYHPPSAYGGAHNQFYQQQQYLPQSMHSQYMAHHNQPIYANLNANYNVMHHVQHQQPQQSSVKHLQTTAEIHSFEKPSPSVNDSKVSCTWSQLN